jgi:hypothetical protein
LKRINGAASKGNALEKQVQKSNGCNVWLVERLLTHKLENMFRFAYFVYFTYFAM